MGVLGWRFPGSNPPNESIHVKNRGHRRKTRSVAWWLIGRFDAFRAKDRGFESRTIRHVETLGKSFTRSNLWRFGMKLRHSICAASGAHLRSNVLQEAL